jgi:hypothetical protein
LDGLCQRVQRTAEQVATSAVPRKVVGNVVYSSACDNLSLSVP